MKKSIFASPETVEGKVGTDIYIFISHSGLICIIRYNTIQIH